MTQRKTSVAKAALDQDQLFTFSHEGSAYVLPRADEAMKSISGGDLMDMLLDDDETSQIRFALKILLAAKPDEKALAALRAKPVEEFAEVLGGWISSSGVSLGE